MIDTPSASFGEISKRIGAKWKAEAAEVRQEFDRKAAEVRQAKQSSADAAPKAGADGSDGRGVKRKKPTANSEADGAQPAEEQKSMEVDDEKDSST